MALFFEDDRIGVQEPIYNNQLQNNAFSDLSYRDMGGVHPPRSHSGLQSIMPHDLGNWRDEMNQANARWAPAYQPGQAFPHGGFEEMQFDTQPPGIVAANAVQGKDSKFNFPSILKGLWEATQAPYKSAEGPAWDPRTGQMLSVEEQDELNARGGYYSDAARHARRQEKRVRDMLQRKKDEKSYSIKNLNDLIAMGYGKQEVVPPKVVTTPNVHGGEGGSQQTFSQTSPGGISQAESRAARGGLGGWRLAQGGRAGYLNGELVGQQTDLIEGSQGGEEFQETVVEGQEQPSREQLEALAMAIFQLPLEQLDERQLLVVYQEAMQGQPMEEAVQEEDVQFAAGGGRIGLRYGGLVSLL